VVREHESVETRRGLSVVRIEMWPSRSMLVLRAWPYPGLNLPPRCRLDEVRAADVEAYKALKLKEGQAAKSVNNHLSVLRKLLNLAVEWGELSHAPRVKQLRVAHGDFQFLTCEEVRGRCRFPMTRSRSSRRTGT
jgi:hypothetical protein